MEILVILLLTNELHKKLTPLLREPLLLEVTHTEFAAAVELIIEIHLFDDFSPALLQSALAPILRPPEDVLIRSAGFLAGKIHLIQILPTGRSKSRSKDMEAVRMSIGGSPAEPVAEALQTAGTPLGLMFQTLRDPLPVLMVIIIIDEVQPVGSTIPAALVPADLILLQREDIRVAVEYGRADTLLEHDLDDRSGTWSTAGVEEDIRLPSGHLQYESLSHII